MKKLKINIAMGLMMMLCSLALQAQPAQGRPGGMNPTPIDGGVSLLLAAGAALGGRKAYKSYKDREM